MKVHDANFLKPVQSCCAPTDDDYKKVETFIQAIDVFSRIAQSCIYVIDYYKREVIYVSENSLLSYGKNTAAVLKSMIFFYPHHVPEEDLEIILEVNKEWFLFFNTIPSEDKLKYSISYDFHLIQPNKRNTLINHRLTPLALDKQFNIWLALCVVTYSSNDKAGNIFIIRRDWEHVYEYDLNIKAWVLKPRIKLTIQEKEILALSVQGLTMGEIAKKLFIEEVTVKFHRKNIFDKLNVKNMPQAVMRVHGNDFFR